MNSRVFLESTAKFVDTNFDWSKVYLKTEHARQLGKALSSRETVDAVSLAQQRMQALQRSVETRGARTLQGSERIEVIKVSNGWLVSVARHADFNSALIADTAVARTPEELVKVLYQWAIGEKPEGLPLDPPPAVAASDRL